MTIVQLARQQKVRELVLWTAHGDAACPFSCAYCSFPGPGRPDAVMTRATLEAAIDFLRAARADASSTMSLKFLGREPLVHFGLVQHAREYAPEIEIVVTTNGWLLTPDTISWLAENNIKIYVYSIDGGPEHNRHRRTREGQPTWDRVAANFQALLPTQGKWMTARGTWSPRGEPDDYDLVGRFRALEALGARSVAMIPDVGALAWDEASVARAYRALADYYGGGKSLSSAVNDYAARLERGETRPRGNCCNTGKFGWAVDPYGGLFTCHQGIHWPATWQVGSLHNGCEVNPAALAISRRVDTWQVCSDCRASMLCMGLGGCAAEFYRHTGDVLKPPPGYCAHLRGMATGLRYWLSLRKDKPQAWLAANCGGGACA